VLPWSHSYDERVSAWGRVRVGILVVKREDGVVRRHLKFE
jgi:hypothetical protein